MTKALSIKVDQALFDEMELYTKMSGHSRNKYINQAISDYNKKKRREELAQKIRIAVELVKESSTEVMLELDQLADGLETI